MTDSIIGNRGLERFDTLVIGSGAGGAAIAQMLAANGQRVLVLEAGSNYFQGLDDPRPEALITRFSNDELKMSRRNLIQPDGRVEPRTYRKNERAGARSFIGDVQHLPKTIGGGSIHADLKVPRYRPEDFHMASLLGEISGASFADWPISYDDLEPFYLHTERELGVQGLDGAPTDPWRSGPYPMKPGVPMRAGLLGAAGAAKLGLNPFPYPTAVTSRPYDGRAACVDCGFCGDYGCGINAKGSAAVTHLRHALLTRNCLILADTRAVRLRTSGAGNEITGVEAIGPTGEPLVYTADRYVLAASPIETTRLLLLSDRMGDGVGNSSGLVGRNLMFHMHTSAIGIFEERVHGHRGRSVTHGFSDFRGVPGDPKRPLGGIVEICGGYGLIGEALTYLQDMKFSGGFLDKMMRESPLRDRVVTLLMQQEDAPQYTNRVDLDPEVKDLDGLPVARVTYQNHAFELGARKFYSPKLLDVLGAAGANYGFIAPAEEVPATHHIMGTLRFGRDPGSSVCDPHGRFHDIGNLYAADGSLMPTGSGFNPTLTLAAMAAWVGAAMIHPSSPREALAEAGRHHEV